MKKVSIIHPKKISKIAFLLAFLDTGALGERFKLFVLFFIFYPFKIRIRDKRGQSSFFD